MSRLFYKFLISSNLCKYKEMELVQDYDVETIIALDCSPKNVKLVELFMEFRKPLLIGGLLYTGPHLQIHSLVIGIDVDDEEGLDNEGGFNHQGKDFSGHDIDKVSDDINEEGTCDDDIVYAFSLKNPAQSIVIQNYPPIYMLSIDPNATHAFEFLKYPDIIRSHRLLPDSESEELTIG
ncbi:hypothetical protein J1N35_030613 [Gossypium stocksii]|uniref:Uncharacterized protein n=1 Tax=Gossypium stocksii TaxID=47602 RepID=A0A9D3V015_9ROSI|nr:hypothetical protein J1N35_030613 [Gossypium stocksii]